MTSALRLIVFFVVASAFYGCKVNNSVAGRNVNFLYQSQVRNGLDVQYKVWYNNDQVKLIWKVQVTSLGIKRDDLGSETVAFNFRYRLFQNYSEALAIDSGLVVVKDVPRQRDEFITDTISLNLKESRRYLVDIVCKDLNSINSDQQFVDLEPKAYFNAQNVLIYNNENELLFSPYLEKLDSYKLKITTQKDRLFVRMYQREFQMAAAPFGVVDPKPFNFKPDAVFALDRNEKGLFTIPIDKKGFYQIAEDSSKFVGPAVYYFGEYFPESRTVLDLLYPLRYITTSDEYSAMLKGENIKKNVDNFWLKIGGSPQRAKELIQAYYSRVKYANTFFSSYLEGWKTDRGMCYMIYGEPDIVYKSTSSETWIYGEEGVYSSLSLVFTKVANPFTNNDFRLNRSTSLKSSWYRSVEFWRQGRIITYK
ncbi:MAG: GWxTD domain-containing protein [Salibacteraceae bacterium]|jgi:GWxTD domain-containing protein|nr:GWxTD domain-containing protein [Salibacteraceae bacterium]MDP4763595.1 GWxTD domain-containing protein [Salibacteraceae bacterium]MDP4934687.1 GWxTD domain-containing protein [Salibacteraceae bacterium]